MTNFNKIITLSKQLASSLLKEEKPTVLQNSDFFNDIEKKNIHKRLTSESEIKKRLSLKNKIDKKADWEKVKNRIGVEPSVRKLYWKYIAAASVLIIVTLTVFTNKFNDEPQFVESVIVNNQIEPGVEKATLLLESGEIIVLEKGKSFQKQNLTSDGEVLIYNNKSSHKLVYNYLTIPRGGQFQLTLSDGTKVWLNSESQLKYPVSFNDSETRQVELVYGEAYFDVSPSTKHKGTSFKVYHNKQEVEVLGTEFNIKAYKDENNIYTTLVEGKVAINTENESKILKPDEQSNYNTHLNTLQLKEVNVFREVAWKYGAFSFKHKSLKEIMKVLSRWYDMEVIFENQELEDVTFNGVLYRNQPIEEVLLLIKSSSSISAYEINNKTILLK
ncbi:FecR family protein [Tenacibaculum adriaticum]|uniref:FecR family protein n=1 Tax=Tenacibaculum adriaticum TaxID=413713 RepID=A0A5S5DWA3_9FLAO|nr:FecR family protein [Tenacibaculum adriaticum]TYQ00194.1 FecR family protein [Tenacibaculum adriaticum]